MKHHLSGWGTWSELFSSCGDKWSRRVFVLACVSLLTACGTARGPEPIINRDGSVAGEQGSKGLEQVFRKTAAKAIGRETGEEKYKAEPTPQVYADLRSRGFELVESNCRHYFDTAGENQKWLYFYRDLIGGLGTLATTVISSRGGNRSRTENVALFTAIGYGGIDIYTKNFLFSAENISAVQDLVIQALSKHRDGKSEIAPQSYGQAINDILENQAWCSPIRIASLVKQAIKAAEVDVVSTSVGEAALLALALDPRRAEIGMAVKAGRPVSSDELLALYWIYVRGDISAKELRCTAKEMLANLSQSPLSTDDSKAPKAVVLRSDWAPAADVQAKLRQIDGKVRANLDRDIESLKRATAQKNDATCAQSAPAEDTKQSLKQSQSRPIGLTIRGSRDGQL